MRHDIIAFGEVLWDIIEGVPNLGGAPLNFAAHARRCGMDAAIVSAIHPQTLFSSSAPVPLRRNADGLRVKIENKDDDLR